MIKNSASKNKIIDSAILESIYDFFKTKK